MLKPMMNSDISSLEIIVEPDQLPSEKPADQDPLFNGPLVNTVYILITGILRVNWIKIGKKCNI